MIIVVGVLFPFYVLSAALIAAAGARNDAEHRERLRRLESAEFDDWLAEQRKLTSHVRLKAVRDRGGNHAA